MIRRRRRKPASAEYVFQHSIDLYSGVGFNLQEPTGAVSGAYNTAVALGRDVLEPDTDFTVAPWATLGTASVDDADSFTTTGTGGMRGQAIEVFAPKTYSARIKGTTTSSNVTIRDGVVTSTIYAQTGATGAFDLVFTFTAASNGLYIRNEGAGTTDIDWPNCYIKQTGIAASSAGLGLLDGADTGTTPGVVVKNGVYRVKSADAATTVIDVYSADLNSIFNPDSGGLFAVASADTWVAGVDYLVNLSADANNGAYIYRTATDLVVAYNAGGTEESITIPSLSPTGLFGIGLLWNTAGAGAVTGLYQGTQSGAVQTIAGTFINNLAATLCTIFAASTTPTNVWAGDGGWIELFTSAPPISEFTRFCYKWGVI